MAFCGSHTQFLSERSNVSGRAVKKVMLAFISAGEKGKIRPTINTLFFLFQNTYQGVASFYLKMFIQMRNFRMRWLMQIAPFLSVLPFFCGQRSWIWSMGSPEPLQFTSEFNKEIMANLTFVSVFVDNFHNSSTLNFANQEKKVLMILSCILNILPVFFVFFFTSP